MAEPLVTAFEVAVVASAGQELGKYGMKKTIKACEKAVESVEQEWEAGWEKDREAGGISSWGDNSQTATA